MSSSEPAATSQRPVVVIGAGPAGLTAALLLAERGVPVRVLEASPRVGGLAQTVEYKGFRFDIGGHRFFTKVPSVRDLWRATLGADFLRRPRQSRIFFDGMFFDYPLKPLAALGTLGVWRSIAVLFSYLIARIRPIRVEVSFEDWVTNRFGRRLYQMFFKAYTEKVWGIPCRTISARWAAQRIRGLSLRTAVIETLLPCLRRGTAAPIKTLISEFEYPRLGPGMMWEAFAARIERLGGSVVLNARVDALTCEAGGVRGVEFEREGRRIRQPASSVISTMPLTQLVSSLRAETPSAVRTAADTLRYRDFIMVALIVDHPNVFPDNWIYIHDPSVRMGRIQNFKNWSPDMVPDRSKTGLGVEYFCTAGDEIWTMPDADLVALAKAELGATGLLDPATIVDGTVVRVPKAYPVYDDRYEGALAVVRAHLSTIANLQTIGRNGTHTYNNQDHSMVMGMLSVRNLFGEKHDLWATHSDGEYLEEPPGGDTDTGVLDVRQLASTQPRRPTLVRTEAAYEPR